MERVSTPCSFCRSAYEVWPFHRAAGGWFVECTSCGMRTAEWSGKDDALRQWITINARTAIDRADDFNGDNTRLIASIDALLDLDDANALVPHGLGKGSHAYRLLKAARHRIEATQAKDEEIAKLVEALETLVGETLGGDLSREDEKAVTPRGSYSTWVSWSDRWAARDLIAKHKGQSLA